MADTLIRPNAGSLSVSGQQPKLTFNMLSSVTKTPGTGTLTIIGKSLTATTALSGAFQWRASSARLSKKPKVDPVTFGDGYEMRQAQGINNNLASYDLTFVNLPQSDGDSIQQYLDQMGAVTAFLWTPPYKTVQGYYVCDSFTRDYDPKRDGMSSITATFREVLG